MADGDKHDSEDRYRKHTLLWKHEDYERVEQAAQALGQQIHADLSVPDFMRGAILKRADEVLGSPSPEAAA
ncbi:MAG: hypothetical protein AB7G23_19095 [Vicinamibacterales bacterium]